MSSTITQAGRRLALEAFEKEYSGASVVITSAGRVDTGTTAHIILGRLECNMLKSVAVAMKVFPSIMSRSKEELLKRELHAARQVRHPNILPFLGTCMYDLHMVLVSQYIPNGNLHEYLKCNPHADRAPFILQIAEAVMFLHEEVHLVHGDLKCQNVLVSDAATAMLADFGLATTIEKAAEEVTTVTSIRAHNTIRFCAPELLLEGQGQQDGRRRSKTRETDVYAFGMLVLQAYTAELPWAKYNDFGVVMQVVHQRIPARPTDERTLKNGFDDFSWDLCCACWKYEPTARATMRTIVRNLRQRSARVNALLTSQIAVSLAPPQLHAYTIHERLDYRYAVALPQPTAGTPTWPGLLPPVITLLSTTPTSPPSTAGSKGVTLPASASKPLLSLNASATQVGDPPAVFTVNPILQYSPHNEGELHFDALESPDKVVLRKTAQPLTTHDISLRAFQVNDGSFGTTLLIRSETLPWSFRIPANVTIGVMIDHIFRFLWASILPEELANLTKRNRAKLEMARAYRLVQACNRHPLLDDRSILRVDWLQGHTLFLGLAPSGDPHTALVVWGQDDVHSST